MADWSRRKVLATGAAALLGGCAHRYGVPRGIAIRPGADQFILPGGPGHGDHEITVHYYRPRRFDSRSPILIVLPGAARNAFDHREAWMPMAAEAGVLVASPAFPEAGYDFAGYDMGGAVRLAKPVESRQGDVYLRDEDFRTDVTPRRAAWLADDLERLFAILKRVTGSSEAGYDMFGHGTGAQIVQRQLLMCPKSRARRVIAANAGFYTLPDLLSPQPAGLAGLGLDRRALMSSFARRLVVLLGEQPTAADPPDPVLHTPTVDRQGPDRLSRGRHFHEFSAAQARARRTEFRWELALAPNLGFDFRGMSRVAARLLYG